MVYLLEKVRNNVRPTTAKVWSSRCDSNGLWGRVWFLFYCFKFVVWKVQRADWDKIFCFLSVHENCDSLQKLFTIEDIEYIVECLNDEFEKYAMSRLKWTSKPKIENSGISFVFISFVMFLLVLFLFIVRTILAKMSLDAVGKLCRKFKILRQKSNLNIDHSLGKCLKHSFDLVKVCLNYESNVDIVMKWIAFGCLVLKDNRL